MFVDALWSPAGKGLTSWLSFVMSNCDVVTFLLVSRVRCGALLYLFLIFALFLTLNRQRHVSTLVQTPAVCNLYNTFLFTKYITY